ncbi:MAG TPA: hypothetical protein VID48_07260 [Solirubrobacteraceae bacterium]|jgi:hypothetical protein
MAAEMATEMLEAPAAARDEPASAAPAPQAKPVGAGANKNDAKAKKDKKGGKASGDPPSAEGPSIAAHPRAARQVARAKSWGGLTGFMLGGYFSLPTQTFAGAGLRALEAGIACYVAAWAAAVFIWRQLVVIEIKSREQQLFNAAHGHPETPVASPPGRARKTP